MATSPDGGDTLVYPAKLVEDAVMAHFNVTAEQRRACCDARNRYDASAGTYRLGAGYGGAGDIGAVAGVREDGDLLELEYGWFENEGAGAAGARLQSGVAAIRLLPGGGWKYLSNRIEPAHTVPATLSQEEETALLAILEELAQDYRTGGAALPPNLTFPQPVTA